MMRRQLEGLKVALGAVSLAMWHSPTSVSTITASCTAATFGASFRAGFEVGRRALGRTGAKLATSDQ